jgi:ABC-2 type transport system ATP-binding protein
VTDTVLEFENVSKSYGGKSVLHGVNLSLHRGRVVGLLGQNGSGKTTLLKCAMGLLRVTSGSARIFGEDAWDLSDKAKARIGYVAQEVDLYEWMRPDQIVALISAFYPRWNQRLVESLLSRWEIDTKEIIARYSVGQKHKMAMVLAMGHEPDLLVLDEPAASLDPMARRDLLATIIEIAADSGRTVLLSTHLTSDLERVASDVVLLKDGTVSYSGSMDTLKESIKTLRLTSRSRLPRDLNIPGLLRSEIDATEALLTVRGVTPDLIRELEAAYQGDIEVRDLNLEDIFIELHRDHDQQ